LTVNIILDNCSRVRVVNHGSTQAELQVLHLDALVGIGSVAVLDFVHLAARNVKFDVLRIVLTEKQIFDTSSL